MPEPENLPLLAALLDSYANLYVDTASTKWIIIELGRDPGEAREFMIKYQKRILFASDLSLGWDDTAEDYYATRYWAQRLFWETDVRNVKLLCPDTGYGFSAVFALSALYIDLANHVSGPLYDHFPASRAEGVLSLMPRNVSNIHLVEPCIPCDLSGFLESGNRRGGKGL